MDEATEWISVGKIERTFGIHGGVRVRSLSATPGRFHQLNHVRIVSPTHERVDTTVTSVREADPGFILEFASFSTPEEAAEFRGGFIQIPKDQVPPLPPGQFYEFDLIGMRVLEKSGRSLGRVEEILETPAHHLLVVRGEQGEHVVPAVKPIVQSVDLSANTVVIDWPELEKESRDAM